MTIDLQLLKLQSEAIRSIEAAGNLRSSAVSRKGGKYLFQGVAVAEEKAQMLFGNASYSAAGRAVECIRSARVPAVLAIREEFMGALRESVQLPLGHDFGGRDVTESDRALTYSMVSMGFNHLSCGFSRGWADGERDEKSPDQLHGEFWVFLDEPRAALWVKKGSVFALQGLDLANRLTSGERFPYAVSYAELAKVCAGTFNRLANEHMSHRMAHHAAPAQPAQETEADSWAFFKRIESDGVEFNVLVKPSVLIAPDLYRSQVKVAPVAEGGGESDSAWTGDVEHLAHEDRSDPVESAAYQLASECLAAQQGRERMGC